MRGWLHERHGAADQDHCITARVRFHLRQVSSRQVRRARELGLFVNASDSRTQFQKWLPFTGTLLATTLSYGVLALAGKIRVGSASQARIAQRGNGSRWLLTKVRTYTRRGIGRHVDPNVNVRIAAEVPYERWSFEPPVVPLPIVAKIVLPVES